MHRETEFRSFAEFYAFYLTEHRHPVSRVLHYIGTWGAILCLLTFAITGEGAWGIAALISGYSFAWIGHFAFEHNRPATFRYPFYSLASDFRMWWQLTFGQLAFRERSSES
jgi:hypothetical protein